MRYKSLNNHDVDKICRLWNKEIGEEFPISTSLFKECSVEDVNVVKAGSLVAIDEETDQIVGFIVAKRFQDQKCDVALDPNIGWIQVLLVDREYRNKGIGSTLLAMAEDALQQTGVQQMDVAGSLKHYFPGIPTQYTDTKSWFEKKGYIPAQPCYDLFNDYNEKEKMQLPSFKDVTFRLLDQSDQGDLLSFLHQNFPGRWEYEAKRYFEDNGSGREFVGVFKDSEIIGFCRVNDSKSPTVGGNILWSLLYEDELGGVGPLGIADDYRGNGYGLAVVEAGIFFLQLRGIEKVVIDWTLKTDFYMKLGFTIWKSYNRYSKKRSE
ncbi:GNAT family N-acetyltransferase [Radiobacillus sp. PE A8.2]|uniref:GNAT family N-acetyltransferase n=1 Tax=Radiobacillus sp. PE A8.2 TaxID=3380349 RepID=UPI00388E6E43